MMALARYAQHLAATSCRHWVKPRGHAQRPKLLSAKEQRELDTAQRRQRRAKAAEEERIFEQLEDLNRFDLPRFSEQGTVTFQMVAHFEYVGD